MELKVRTLRGAVNLKAVSEDTSVDELKAQLHDNYKSSLQIPAPEFQNLVHEGRVLRHGLLRTAGVSPGSTLVVLQTVPLSAPVPAPASTGPTAAEIRAAIFDEARRRGIEHKLRDEPPSASHPSLNLPTDLMDMDNQLMGLIEALEGRLGLLRQGGRQGQAGVRVGPEAGLLSGPGDAQQQQQGPAVAENAGQRAAAEVNIQAPEPEAEHVTQLCDMGFPDAVVRKALILHRNRVPEAVEWLLQHAEDADAAEPVTQEHLRRLYGAQQPRAEARAAGSAGESAAASAPAAGVVASALRELHMSLLQAVGIDADSAQGMLDRSDVGEEGAASTGAAAVAGAVEGQQQQQQQAAADPLEAFRRRLQQQLAEGPEEASASTLADLFPLEAFMNLGNAHEDNPDDDDNEDGQEEEEEEGNVEGNAAQPDHFRF